MAEARTPDLSKHPDAIAGMFDAIAERYDFLNHLLSAGIDKRWRRRAIQSLRLTGGERVLDLCTGTGDLALAAAASAKSIVGVDFSAEMLRVGQQKVRHAARAGSIRLVRGDAMRIPLASGTVDAVTIAFGIRNVQNMPAAIADIRRVLSPGGRVAVLEFAMPASPLMRWGYKVYSRHVLPRIGRAISHHNAAYRYLPESISAFATPDEFVTILRQGGFTDISAIPLTFGIVFLYTGVAR